MVKFPQKGFIRKNLILKLFFSFWTACQVKLCPVLRNRSDSMQFLPSRKQGAPWRARHFFAARIGAFPQKTHG